MHHNRLNAIKDFAEKNFLADEDDRITVSVVTSEGESVAVTNIWMDRSGRFSLSDEQAVREWGLQNVVLFINTIDEFMQRCEYYEMYISELMGNSTGVCF